MEGQASAKKKGGFRKGRGENRAHRKDRASVNIKNGPLGPRPYNSLGKGKIKLHRRRVAERSLA